MTLLNLKPEPIKIYDEFDSMISQILGADWNSQNDKVNNWLPKTDVKETKDSFIIRADVAGLTKKDIHVKVVDNTITISGERKEDNGNSNDYFHLRERQNGLLNRSFNLPDTVNQEKISASCKNGILTIEIEKNEEMLPVEKVVKVS